MAEKSKNQLSRKELVRMIGDLEQRNLALEEQLTRLRGNEARSDAEVLDKNSDDLSGEAEENDPAESGEDAALKKRRQMRDYFSVIGTVCISLIVAAAAVVLIVNFAFPVMRIYGSSMSSTLVDGDIVISRKTTKLERGDVCAFYAGSMVMCKRVIGLGGDVIEIDSGGTVTVNGEVLEEPYLKGKSLGECNIEFPYTVPENSYFVLGDNRRVSIDSRNTLIGCIPEDQVVGKLLFCVMPFPSFGKVE